ncbi:hypothetical protein F5Y03DRAFT_375381 [Xylaria venustula]|nr:hypothetical protein F5Y03DRAFT_375381 [Xylaria venustula]
MSSAVQPLLSENEEFGFSAHHRISWSEYMRYRPIYPDSFFRRIYEYYGGSPGACWSTAHDVGAGNGIVSSNLATKFDHVVVSDPNDGYNETARELLDEKSGLPESKFVFLKEPAEHSSVEAGTVDLITACECMHWTDTVTRALVEGLELSHI